MPSAFRALAFLGATLLAAANAAAQPAGSSPASAPAGSTAAITDTALGGGRSGGTFFVLAEVDGKPVRTAIENSQRASQWQGANLRLVGEERQVAAGRVKLRLVARVAHAAPIAEIFGALRNDPVAGVIEVELQPAGRYRVNGILDTYRREVWLEEEGTQRLLGEKIVQPPSAQAQAQMAEATSFACCNLRYDDGWIGDDTYTGMPFVPAGARIRFLEWGRNRANVLIDGRKMSIGVDLTKMTREQFAKMTIVDENPSTRIDTWPAEVQAAVRGGKVMPGMTREQVIVALGYPRLDAGRTLEAQEWTYWLAEREEFSIVWGEDGRVKAVEAATRIKQQVMPRP